jgi:predicted ATPase with chaperone activity
MRVTTPVGLALRSSPEATKGIRAHCGSHRRTARAYHRELKVARTIADPAGREAISSEHLSEAIGYRRLDRSAQRR